MRFWLALLLLPLLAWAEPSMEGQKVEVVRHNNVECVVTGRNTEIKRVEVVYTVGNEEHHLYVADRFAAKQFMKNPAVYLAKLERQEQRRPALAK